MDNYNDYVNDYMNSYNCPDCNDANLQSDKNARKINEVIDQVNALIQVNNETTDIIKDKVNEVAGEIVEIKVNEVMGNLTTEIDDINSSLDNLESEVDELKEGNIDIDLNNYATKDYVDDAINNANLEGGALTDTLKQKYDTAYKHSQVTHAPITAQKNSDILKSEIEAKLVGTITSHSHNTVNGFSFWFGTQSEYDAIATKSNTTIYMIKEG